MIKTLRIGNYDVVFSGRIGENVNTYDIVNFVRYDEKRKPIGKKSLLFRREHLDLLHIRKSASSGITRIMQSWKSV